VASGTVLIVDDDRSCRMLIVDVLREDGFRTVEAATGREALEALDRMRPDIAIIDVHLPGTSGYEIHRRLRERFGEELPVIFVSGHRTEPYDRVAGLLLGADDYVVKPFDPDELAARVRMLWRRWGQSADGVEAHAFTNGLAALTDRECEVLELLAGGLDQHEIARRLVISSRTVATHIQHVLTKLGVHSRAQAVAVALRPNGVDGTESAHVA
jgi:DNA-binding NarL/FixJ family response regulator